MEQGFIVEPDLNFIKDMKKAGGDSLKKCFQCATCSVVCKLTPDDSPFPRKEMIWAQWGQKDKLLSDPDVWLCHQCNDCTANCPRGAKPGDVLAAVRNAAFKTYAFPSFMGTWLSRPGYLPLVLGLPILILLIMISGGFSAMYSVLPHGSELIGELAHAGWGNMPDGPIRYANFYPELGIDLTFMTLAALAVISLVVGLNRFWKAMVENHGRMGLMGTPAPNFLAVLPTIFAHNKFKTCDESKDRYYGHGLVFYGFVFAFLATFTLTTAFWVFGIATPHPLYSPAKIFGNIGAVGIIIGGIWLAAKRLSGGKGSNSYYDWTLIWLVLGLGITGLSAELARLADARSIAYPIYFTHLVFIAYLFMYLPFSKMAHLAYRSVGMTFARQAERDLLPQDEAALEPEAAAAE